MPTRMFNPPHPGMILKDALKAIPMTVTEFAGHIGVSRVSLSRVVNERAGITPEMSIKIAQAFGQPTSDIWFKIQGDYDFWHASRAKRKKIKPIRMKASKVA